ncbi:MAG: hypothetical protein HY907_23010 [Deltaproteobacteria bacterium]|nr:hypothetical protein [Deltaproteobacteria bacterium]
MSGCACIALLLGCAGCTALVRRTVPAEPLDWQCAGAGRPGVVLDGGLDPATGELVVALAVDLPADMRRPVAAIEECEEPSYGPSVGVLVPGLALSVAGGGVLGTRGGGGSGFVDGLSAIGGVGSLIAGLGLTVAGLTTALLTSGVRTLCRTTVQGEPGAGPAPTPAVLRFVVRVVRPDGREIGRTVDGTRGRIPLEPDLFRCPGECLATDARRAAAGFPDDATLRHERLVVEATPIEEDIPIRGMPATASAALDVVLMPPGAAPSLGPPPAEPPAGVTVPPPSPS